MALDRAIEHGKEKRRPYRGSKATDATCRPGGSCPYCQRGRKHKHRKRLAAANDKEGDCDL